MTLLRGSAPLTGHRLGLLLLSGALAALVILFAAACGEGTPKEPTGTSAAQKATPDNAAPDISPEERAILAETVVTIYSSPTCGCCQGYAEYLEEQGFEVELIRTEDPDGIKEDLAIPTDMRSCHTAIVQEYFVEGHVPVEAIWKLLKERPEIDGIALPGMPLGSPGMSGDKQQPFTVYSIAAGKIDEFMTL